MGFYFRYGRGRVVGRKCFLEEVKLIFKEWYKLVKIVSCCLYLGGRNSICKVIKEVGI